MIQTVKRSNKLIEALSLPNITLYNMRSVWAKLDNVIEDIEMRNTNICFLTEVWEKAQIY